MAGCLCFGLQEMCLGWKMVHQRIVTLGFSVPKTEESHFLIKSKINKTFLSSGGATTLNQLSWPQASNHAELFPHKPCIYHTQLST
ncbi:hypothetical protein Q7C36_011351 [Tachysurus vachellii]|uniref:Uncharacterized protein n=1 Tax=Tachysurus vachellii TaxID=175792 RepID=A0AA88SMH8_TACVA|nr:hypothetical protein Q7C36_011351 [Tachysurus vachellii]